MMRVVGGTDPATFHPVAEQLLDRHALLRAICEAPPGQSTTSALRNLDLSSNLQSLLSVYASHARGKLDHAIGVALLCSALAARLSADAQNTRLLVIAGMAHDVGELYISPAFFTRGVKLTPQQWKHVATHPIVGAHILSSMPGAGPAIGSAVLAHHERLDGFGYPKGSGGNALSIAGQVVAVAEMLIGLLESGSNHAERAEVAMKLVPGEFSRRLTDVVAMASRLTLSAPEAAASSTPAAGSAGELASRVAGLIHAVRHVRGVQPAIEAGAAAGSAALRALLANGFQRWERIGVALSSTGLDTCPDPELEPTLSAMTDAERMEVSIVARELYWRMTELERQMVIRSEDLEPAEARRVRAFIDQAQPRDDTPVADATCAA
jgi:hypothetical protein